MVPALIGGLGGALLLRYTSPALFERIVPGLLLFATMLFIFAPAVRKRLKLMPKADGATRWGLVMPLQLFVAVYGGYFGAGMGILMLSILSLMGMTDMLVVNAFTSLLSLAINGSAGVIFISSRLISWPLALAMAVGAVLGGYFAAGVARKIGSDRIRALVITVGLVLAFVMLIKVVRGS